MLRSINYTMFSRGHCKNCTFFSSSITAFLFTLNVYIEKRNCRINYKIHHYCELPSWISISKHLKECLVRNLTPTASRNVMRVECQKPLEYCTTYFANY